MSEETTPNIGSMNDEELKELIDKLTTEEQEVSYRRRILHGQIDILRAELVNRLRDHTPDGDSMIKGDDVERLHGRGPDPDRLTVGLEDRVGVHPGRRQGLAELVQGLAQRTGRDRHRARRRRCRSPLRCADP